MNNDPQASRQVSETGTPSLETYLLPTREPSAQRIFAAPGYERLFGEYEVKLGDPIDDTIRFQISQSGAIEFSENPSDLKAAVIPCYVQPAENFVPATPMLATLCFHGGSDEQSFAYYLTLAVERADGNPLKIVSSVYSENEPASESTWFSKCSDITVKKQNEAGKFEKLQSLKD